MSKLALSAFLADQVGIENIAKTSKWGRLLYSQGVARTAEFRRIEALPRRVWESDPTLVEATRAIEADVRLPSGGRPCGPDCRCPRSLWPNQAAALIEAATYHGLFAAPHGVGRGKALISILLPTVMRAERPVLFVPAQLRNQTLRKVLPMLALHWRLHPRLKVVGYSELSLAKNRRMLFDLAPDLIVLDECHSVKNAQAARTKRLREYLKEHPLTRVAALSGTVTRRSLLDYWQLLLWTLKPDLAPLPHSWREVSDWANALDEGLEEHERGEPGALALLCREGEAPRDGYRRRLTETPGVVATSAVDLGVSLRLSRVSFSPPAKVQAALAKLRKTWTTPYGDEISEGVDLWRHARELALGFFYRWWDHAGVVQCLEKTAKSAERTKEIAMSCRAGARLLPSTVEEILKSCARTTERDTDLVQAVERLRSDARQNSRGISKQDTGSLSDNTKRCSQSTTGRATSAEKYEVTGRTEGNRDAEEIAWSLITTMRRGACVGFSVHPATGRSASWEILLRACPGLLSTFDEAFDAAAPPKDWLEARRAWKRLARETLTNNRRGLDSELLVARDFFERHKRGESSETVATWFAWHEIKGTFEITTVAEWIDDFAIRRAAAWLADSSEGDGIAWVEHIAFGERLAKASGRPYFGAGMKASAEILDARGPIIASIAAHGEGKNLQAWSRALVLSPPSSGKTWEQLLGRQHREGQLADEVSVDVLLHAEEQEESVRQAIRDAGYIEQTTGARQKLNFASRDF